MVKATDTHLSWFLVGVFLTSMCGLMLQIVQTRMLSVIGNYTMAFFAIGVAMLGLTAGARWQPLISLAYNEPVRFRERRPRSITSRARYPDGSQMASRVLDARDPPALGPSLAGRV